MITAARALSICTKHAAKLMHKLRIPNKTQALISIIIDNKDDPPYFGLTTWLDNNKIQIEIYSKRHTSEREILMTLYHELLHIRLMPFKLKYAKEEAFIHGIERCTRYLMHKNLQI